MCKEERRTFHQWVYVCPQPQKGDAGNWGIHKSLTSTRLSDRPRSFTQSVRCKKLRENCGLVLGAATHLNVRQPLHTLSYSDDVLLTCGPALMTSSVASSSYFLKFSMKSLPSFSTSPLKSAVPFHDLAGLRSSSGTLGQVLGTDRPKVS
jgi:hypothetical protein